MKKLTKIITHKTVKLSALAVIITVLVFGGVLFISPQQAIQAEASTAIALFNTTGQMTRQQAQNIMNALGDTPADSSSINRNTQFRLFPDIELSSTHATALSRLHWRIVNVDGDRVTFWASDSYRSIGFMSTSSMYPVYSESILRQFLLSDFTHLTSEIPNINNHILIKGSSVDGAVAGDRIFIPSLQEVQNGGTWGLNTALRSFPRMGDAASFGRVWLRTPASFNPLLGGLVSYNGSVSAGLGTGSHSRVRPALHISLQSIQEAADVGAGGGTVRPPDDNNGNGNNNNNNGNNSGDGNGNNNNSYTESSFNWWIGLSAILGLIVLGTFTTAIIRFFKKRKYADDGDDWNW